MGPWQQGQCQTAASPPLLAISSDGAAKSRVRQRGRKTPRRQEAEVADARESPWKNMFQETAQENLVSHCDRSLLVAMSVVLPAERDVGVSEIDEPMVGDCDPMRVPGQIVQNVFGAAEGALRIYHPVFAK